MRYLQRRQNVISSLPVILAPILSDSPAYRISAEANKNKNKFSVKQFNEVILSQVRVIDWYKN